MTGSVDKTAIDEMVSATCCPVCGSESACSGESLGAYRLFACSDCGLRFAPDAFDVEVDYDDVYDSADYKAKQVEPLVRGVDPRQFATTPNFYPFFRHVKRKGRGRLLDIGCGTGRFCHGARSAGWDVCGIDTSSRAIEIARRFAQFPVENLRVEEAVQRGDRFDVVTSFEVLEHLKKPVEFLASAKGLLEADGQLFCTVPNWDCSEVQTSILAPWLPPIHLLFFTKTALRRAAELAGLSEVEVGEVRLDPFRGGLMSRLKWLRRRLLKRPNPALGLWLLARR